MKNERNRITSEENGKIISFNFTSDEEETSADIHDEKNEVSNNTKSEKKEDKAVKNKRQPINNRQPVNKNSGRQPVIVTEKDEQVKPIKEEAVKTENAAEAVKTEIVKDEVKTEIIKEEVKNDSPKEEAKAEASKEETKAESAKEESKTESAKEDAKTEAESVKEEAKTEAAKEEAETEPVKEEAKTEAAPEKAKEESAEDEIVFAVAAKPKPAKKIAQQKITKKKSGFPVIPVVASAAVIALAVAGAIFVINGTNKPEIDSGSESAVSEEAKDAAASGQEDSLNDLPLVNADTAEIKTINTASIVFGSNVTVSGVKVEGMTLNQAYDAMQSRLRALRDEIKIKINCGSKSITITQNDFDFDTDVSNVLIQAYHYSRGELDKPTVAITDNGGITDFTVTSVLNKNSISKAVEKVADKFDVKPQDAHVKSFDPEAREKFTYEGGSDGYLISQKKVTEEITKILDKGEKTGTFNVTALRTTYKKSLENVKANTKLIGSHCTSCTNVSASVHNMQLAIKTCNGYVVKPGETFSFNGMTGDTTTGALGYVPSTAIVSGGFEQQYGGGICQASTTIYIAALKAGMQVVERHAHQYPSSYADIGTDATVDYGNLDMKFKNPYDYPVYIATYVYDCNNDGIDEICVEFYGPISAEWDEIVPIGWVTGLGGNCYTVKGAQVYFKDGKEVKREFTPAGDYDYTGMPWEDGSTIPDDVEFGPKNVTPTLEPPTIYSPNGCGSCGPVPYGTASQYLTGQSE